MHVEFFGPPGSGKTTIRGHIIEEQGIYGGVDGDGPVRYVNSLVPLGNAVPHAVKKKLFIKFWYRGLRDYYFNRFLDHNRDIFDLLCQLTGAVDNSNFGLWRLFTKYIGAFQFAICTVLTDEIACVDELFFQHSLSIAQRRDEFALPEEGYFRAIPKPDLLIWVDCPESTCLRRQKHREQTIVEKPYFDLPPEEVQHEIHVLCEEVVSIAEKFDVEVFTIQNDSGIRNGVEQVRSAIKSMQEPVRETSRGS